MSRSSASRATVVTAAACALLLVVRTGAGSTLSGTTAGDHFGWSVARAGDVNGDGQDDLLIGIPDRDQGGQDAGQVQLYLGLPDGQPQTPALTLTGEAAGDEFGYAVSTAGDLNQDGYDDFLVGAPGRSTVGLQAGRVYLFLGGPVPDGTPDTTWDGDLAQGRLGASLAGGFDYNHDGRSDFAVGAPGYSAAGVNAGQVRIYLGAAAAFAVETYILNADQANWALGWSLAPAGDFNHDGIDDLAAGAPQPYDTNSGRVVVWFGQTSTLDPPLRLVLTGEVGTDTFGWDVARAGDVNQDGYDDVAIGAPQYDADNGAVYLYGGPDPTTAFWRAVGPVAGNRMGTALDGGFDWNGDGKPDLAVGEPGADSVAANAGAVALFYGGAVPPTTADTTFLPEPPIASYEADDAFGSSVRFAGSLNGHAYAVLAAGAPLGNAAAGAEAGYVNLMAKAAPVVPVRLLDFAAVAEEGGVQLEWSLADAMELAGLRVESPGGVRAHAVHAGWLLPSVRSLMDPAGEAGDRYRLVGLDRTGSTLTLGETTAALGVTHPLTVSAPDRNPFRDAVRFRVDGPAARGSVTVWDVQGRPVRRLWDGALASGPREFTWDGRDDAGRRTAPGIYLIRVRRGDAVAAIRVVRLP